MDEEAIIRFEKVRKTFGSACVLDGISFDVARGETFVLVGPSGTGKSVTLKHMVRLLTPDSGMVWVGDVPVNQVSGDALSRVRDRFGYLFQGGALLAWMSVGENIALPLQEKTDMSPSEIQDRVQEVLEMVGMGGDGDKRPSEISGGMKKRAGLARAIVRDPDIVLYDEPTSGLDPVTSRTIDRLIQYLQEKTNMTSIVVTHDLHSALAIGSRIAVLHEGHIIEIANPKDFLSSDKDEVQRFLASQYITKRGAWEES